MKSRKLVTKAVLLIMLSFVFVACGKNGNKPAGPGKGDLQTMIEAYEKENAALNEDIRKKDTEIDLLKNELMRLQQQTGVDDDTINGLKDLLGRGQADGSIFLRDGKIVMDSDVTFGSGKDSLTTKGKSILKDLLPSMKGKTVFIVGHSDSDPISKSKHTSNWELSSKRAAHVIEFLVANGMNPEKITGVFNAEFKPVPGEPKNKQRRIEIEILK